MAGYSDWYSYDAREQWRTKKRGLTIRSSRPLPACVLQRRLTSNVMCGSRWFRFRLVQTAGRVVGCILGGAIGNALGGPYEGHSPPITFRLPTQWILSDDTQLTLATCEALSQDGGVSPERIASRFVSWYQQGKLSGLGASTLKALRDLSLGAHWAVAGRKGDMAAGNGAAMRAHRPGGLPEPA